MPYVNVPNDLSKVKTKMAFNLSKRQLICFGGAGIIGIPAYLFARSAIGNSAAMLLMITLMLPAFFLAMYERDGLPFEKVLRNIVRACFIRPKSRPYVTENFYQWILDSGQLIVENGQLNEDFALQNPPKLSTIHCQLSTNKGGRNNWFR